MFHYDYIQNKYSNNSRLLLIDTDNLMYEIKTEDAYEVFSRDKQILDFSNYYDDSNKLVVVKMKNKTSDVAIEEFVGLKQKMYSFLVDDSSKHKKAKCE